MKLIQFISKNCILLLLHPVLQILVATIHVVNCGKHSYHICLAKCSSNKILFKVNGRRGALLSQEIFLSMAIFMEHSIKTIAISINKSNFTGFSLKISNISYHMQLPNRCHAFLRSVILHQRGGKCFQSLLPHHQSIHTV